MDPSITLLRALVDTALTHIAVIDEHGDILFANAPWDRFGRENQSGRNHWVGQNYLEVCRRAAAAGDASAALAVQGIERVMRGEISEFLLEYPCHSPTERRWFLMRALALTVQGGRYFAIYHDRFMNDSELRSLKERLALATDVGGIGVWEQDPASGRVGWDHWMYRIHGRMPGDAEAIWADWLACLHPEDRARVADSVEQAVRDGQTFDCEYRVVVAAGPVRTVLMKGQALCDTQGRPCRLIGVCIDISAQKQAEERIRDLAFHDQLTGLPNRTLFHDRLRQALRSSERTGSTGALLFLDLDHFKRINDTAGHELGDRLLQQVARRLTGVLREEDTLCRMGGDEFVALIPGLGPAGTAITRPAEAVATKLLQCLQSPFDLDGQQWQITVSIGITVFQGHGATCESVMKEADLAMYKAKGLGRNHFHFFSPDLQADLQRRLDLERDLRSAVERSELCLYFQPQIDDQQGVVGAEALIRWRHPTRGLLGPKEFIPLAEESGLILPLGSWVLEQACRTLADWAQDPVLARLTLSVNLSAHQLHQADFTSRILNSVQAQAADPNRLKLELTESLLVDEIEQTIVKMRVLREAGIRFSLDDFGTGYSSLGYLKRLPLDQLKIDQSFVRDILIDRNDAEIARTVTTLAGVLGLGVIAEGVEEEGQCRKLRSLGCSAYQGFLYSRPLPAVAFAHYVHEQSGRLH